jgi:UDP:flavonoid glycosyltransferase YjiC (YdhE family)
VSACRFDNAARVARSGCGVHFDASSLSIGRVTKAMSRLLSDDQVARSCVKTQQLMVTGDAARQAAVAKVEELALCPRTYCQR